MQGGLQAHGQPCHLVGSAMPSIQQIGRTTARVEDTTIVFRRVGIIVTGIGLTFGTHGRVAQGANTLELSDAQTGPRVVFVKSLALPGWWSWILVTRLNPSGV